MTAAFGGSIGSLPGVAVVDVTTDELFREFRLSRLAKRPGDGDTGPSLVSMSGERSPSLKAGEPLFQGEPVVPLVLCEGVPLSNGLKKQLVFQKILYKVFFVKIIFNRVNAL